MFSDTLNLIALLYQVKLSNFKTTQYNTSKYKQFSFAWYAAVRTDKCTNISEEYAASILRAMQDSITISSAVRTAQFASPTEKALRGSTQLSRIPV